MSVIMNASPYENVATKGSRTMAHRARLNGLGSPTLPGVDAALKAIYRDGIQIFPAGNATVETEFRRQFEARADVLDLALRIYENALNTEIGLATGTLEYEGLWDASTNTPPLASGVGTKAHYRVVSVKGTTNLDGINDWNIGDWAIFNGTTWQKIDNSDPSDNVIPTVIVFREGFVGLEPGVYGTWPALMAFVATLTNPITVRFDESITSPLVIPAGTHNFPNGTHFQGSFNVPFTNVKIADGCVLNGVRVFEEGLDIENQSNTPVIVLNSPGTYNIVTFQRGSNSYCTGTAPLVLADAGATVIAALYGAEWLDGGAGTPVVRAINGSTFLVNPVVVSSIGNDTLGCTVGSTVLLNLFADTSYSPVQTPVLGTLQISYPDKAKQVEYTPATPSLIPATPDWTAPSPMLANVALDELMAKKEIIYRQEMIVPSIAAEDRYRIPVGSLFLDAASEATLEVDTGSGYTPAVYGVDYVHLPRGYLRPCVVYGVLDAVIGFRWINGAVGAGWTFRFRWLERRIIAAPTGVMAVRLDGSGTAIDPSTRWYVNNSAALCNGLRVALLPGYCLELWRLGKRRGGLDSGGGSVGDGRRYVPYLRGSVGNQFIDFQPLYKIGKGKRQFKVCFYNPLTGARSALCAETVFFENFTNRDDNLGVSGFLRSREGAVWVI